MTDQKRVLILGNTEFKGNYGIYTVDSLAWEFADLKSPRDYDVLILVISTLNPENLPYSAWSHIVDNFTLETACHIAKHDGCMVTIIGDLSGTDEAHGKNWAPEWLFGIETTMDRSEGQSIKRTNLTYLHPEFTRICNYYYYSLQKINRPHFLSPNWLVQCFEKGSARLEFESVLSNRYDSSIAGKLSYHVGSSSIGPFYMFPDIETDGSAVLKAVLDDLLGIKLLSKEPDWVAQIIAPLQPPIEASILECERIISEENLKLEELAIARTEARRFLKLIYGGEHELEDIVLETLGYLGAEVEHPRERNKEDGWIKVNFQGQLHFGVLEIKSTKGTGFNEDGRRQLAEWIYRTLDSRGVQHRGIFIGNSQKETPIRERENPFSDSWKSALKTHKMTALLTSVLYDAYEAKTLGTFDHDSFWNEIFGTDGVISSYAGAPEGDS